MKRFATGLLAAFMLLCAVPLQAAKAKAPAGPAHGAPALTAKDLGTFYAGLMPYALHRADIAGAVLVVVKDGKVLFAHGYGYANVAKQSPVIPDRTLFRPGSISKLFTWTSVMQLVQAGKIDLDTDVNEYIDFTIPPYDGKPVTMRELMTHSAGFEDTGRDLFVKHANQLYPLGEYLKKVLPARIFAPGTTIAYSNYGATLAGYIVQRISGEPFDQYVTRHILAPLRMDHSSFAQPLPARLAALMATGYGQASGKPIPFEYVEAAPAGALSSTGTDMAHFMLAYLNGGTYDGYQLLEPATIKEMWTLALAPAPGMNGFDLGFYQENRNGLQIVGHAGDTEAFHSDLHLLRQKHIGVFMSFNSAGHAGAAENVRVSIFRAFLDRYFPYAPPAEKTVADPQPDAARVAGWYITSRREQTALRLLYALGQVQVTKNPDGTIEVSMLKDIAGDPLHWREVGPLYYRQIDGQAHLKFTADAGGRILSWTTDDFIPVFIFQRVNGLTALGTLKPMLTVFIAVLVISLSIRLGGWIARRRLGLQLALTKNEQRIHLAARIGAIVFLAIPALWIEAFSLQEAITSSAVVNVMLVLYTIGVIGILGGLAMIAESALRVAHGPGGWLVRFGEIVVGIAALYGIWFIFAFGLANFATNF
ncbi:MAG TPA: serine hydrolase domain-containing protein [Candidatus Baltobacteraceae bacterium]|nr:serine hydrolase domain-containing protein [Candidatus Baltobacteraceae bacterium]